MLDEHGTSNALRRETIRTILEVEVKREQRHEKKVDKELWERPFSGKYRETSSDIDKEPIMFVQFIRCSSVRC